MDIRNKMMELKFSDDEKKNKLLEFVFDYDRLTMKKEDLKKKTRLKTIIPPCLRCSAKRVNGEQCTRRKNKDGFGAINTSCIH